MTPAFFKGTLESHQEHCGIDPQAQVYRLSTGPQRCDLVDGTHLSRHLSYGTII